MVHSDTGNIEYAAWDARLEQIQKMIKKNPNQPLKAEKKEIEYIERLISNKPPPVD